MKTKDILPFMAASIAFIVIHLTGIGDKEPIRKALNKELFECTIVIHKVTATVYHNTKEQCNNDPYHSSDGTYLGKRPYKLRVLAISRDLEKQFPMGSKVLVLGVGEYSGYWTIRDRMHEKWTNKIDLLIDPGMSIGKWNAKIVLI